MTQPGQQQPIDPTLDRVIAETYLRVRQGRYEEAKERLAQAKTLAPEHPAVLEVEGDLFYAQGRYRQAERLYRQAFQGDPKNAKLEEKFATALVKMSEPEMLAKLGPDTEDSIWQRRVSRPVWASAILSAFLPGLGQLYNGDFLKGGIILIFSIRMILYNILYPLIHSFKDAREFNGIGEILSPFVQGTMLASMLFFLALMLYSVIDAAWIASNMKKK